MIVCARCREPNPDDAVHCTSCRAYLAWARTGETPAQPQQPPPPPQPQHPQHPQQPATGQQWPNPPRQQGPHEQVPPQWPAEPAPPQHPRSGSVPPAQPPGRPYDPGAYPGPQPGGTGSGGYPQPYAGPPGSPSGPPPHAGGPYGGAPPAQQGRPPYGGGPYPGPPTGQQASPPYAGASPGEQASPPYGGGPYPGPPTGEQASPPYGGSAYSGGSTGEQAGPAYGGGPHGGVPSGERGVPPYGGSAYSGGSTGEQGGPAYGGGPHGGGSPGEQGGPRYGGSAYSGAPPGEQDVPPYGGGQRPGASRVGGAPGQGAPGQGAPHTPAPPTPPGVRRTVNTVQLGRVAPVDPLAPRVPERTIGVSIAEQQQARVAPRAPVGQPPGEQERTDTGEQAASGGFDAVQPQELVDRPYQPQPTLRTAAPTGPPPLAVEGRPLDVGEIRCPVCGHALPEGRRFCRCGASLVKAKGASGTAGAMARLPWYRRLGDFIGSGRDFRRSMRGANRGLRATYNVGLSARTQLVRASLLLGTVGLGLSQFGPWGPDLRGQLTGRLDKFLPKSFVDIPVEQAATDPATKALPGYDVKFAVDGDPGRAWAAPWVPASANGQPCQRAGGAPALVLTFRQPDAVRRVTIEAGLADGNDERSRQARPRQVDLLFSDGTCTVLDLTDSAAAQHVDVRANGVTSVRVTIVDAYDARDASGTPLVSISELSFQRQK